MDQLRVQLANFAALHNKSLEARMHGDDKDTFLDPSKRYLTLRINEDEHNALMNLIKVKLQYKSLECVQQPTLKEMIVKLT